MVVISFMSNALVMALLMASMNSVFKLLIFTFKTNRMCFWSSNCFADSFFGVDYFILSVRANELYCHNTDIKTEFGKFYRPVMRIRAASIPIMQGDNFAISTKNFFF